VQQPGSTPGGRLATLRNLTPDDDPAVFIELARQILGDLTEAPAPVVEAEVRIGLGRALRLAGQLDEAVTELEAAADLAAELDRSDLLDDSLVDLARAQFFLGNFSAAIATCRRALDTPAIGADGDRAWRHVNITAACELQLGRYRAAIETSAAALDQRQEAGDRNAEATLLNNIGVAHMYLGDYDSALEFFQRARLIKAELGESVGVADILANVGDIKQLQGQFDEAITIHREALAMRRREGGDLRVAQSLRSLAAALVESGGEREALERIDEALELVRRIGAEPELVVCLAVEAEVLAALGRGEQATASATESLELARRLGTKGYEIAALDALAEAHVASKQPERAIESLVRARELERELGRTDTRSKFAEFQAAYRSREAAREIEALRAASRAHDSALAGARRWRLALVSALAVLVGAAVVGWLKVLSAGRRSREEAARRTELARRSARLAQRVDRLPAGLFQTDRDGRIVFANAALAAMMGFDDPEHLAGKRLADLVVDAGAVDGLLDELRSSGAVSTRELGIVGVDGDVSTVLVRAVGLNDGDRDLVEGLVVDISERDRLERDRRRVEIETRQNQKLESLGILAGGIAHDFNNQLMAILSNISLAKHPTASAEERTRRLIEAEEVCLRATGLTQQLLTFSKGGRPIRTVASIGRLVEEATASAARGGNCHYDCRSNPELWPVEVDGAQLAQVVQNLVVNAIEAMPRGGTVTVTADNVHLVEGDVPALEAARYVRIDVTDTGIGIPEDHLETIFDPFFTTKKGRSGLGLATAFSIVRSHGGAIVVHTGEDHGSRLSVYLPASDKEHTATTEAAAAARGHGRLLIMDDDDAVRSAAGELLETIGYQVVAAADGAEAVELYRQAIDEGHRFDAVILDLTVPDGIGGRETMSRLAEIDPGVTAIVSSGYSTDPVMANYREHGFAGVAVKPYRLAELASTLQRLIGPDGAD
jgi:PAS domain S-box-containing protein